MPDAYCNKCGFIGPVTTGGSHTRPSDGQMCNYMCAPAGFAPARPAPDPRRDAFAAAFLPGALASGSAFTASDVWAFVDELLAADQPPAPTPSEINHNLVEALTLILRDAKSRLASDDDVMTTVVHSSMQRIAYLADRALKQVETA